MSSNRPLEITIHRDAVTASGIGLDGVRFEPGFTVGRETELQIEVPRTLVDVDDPQKHRREAAVTRRPQGIATESPAVAPAPILGVNIEGRNLTLSQGIKVGVSPRAKGAEAHGLTIDFSDDHVDVRSDKPSAPSPHALPNVPRRLRPPLDATAVGCFEAKPVDSFDPLGIRDSPGAEEQATLSWVYVTLGHGNRSESWWISLESWCFRPDCHGPALGGPAEPLRASAVVLGSAAEQDSCRRPEPQSRSSPRLPSQLQTRVSYMGSIPLNSLDFGRLRCGVSTHWIRVG